MKTMMIPGFYKTHGISWLMEPLFSSQAGLCSVELSSYSSVPLFIDSFHAALGTCFEVCSTASAGSLVPIAVGCVLLLNSVYTGVTVSFFILFHVLMCFKKRYKWSVPSNTL